jgi:hypothetical protein
VILAHHGGEPALVAALATALGGAPLALALVRFRLGELLDRFRRRR